MTPRPPISTLFPYTTLFRSDVKAHGAVETADDAIADCALTDDAVADGSVHAHDGAGADRKSTRLNSSHGSISYAVFCLKKKNTLQNVVGRKEKTAQQAAQLCLCGEGRKLSQIIEN